MAMRQGRDQSSPTKQWLQVRLVSRTQWGTARLRAQGPLIEVITRVRDAEHQEDLQQGRGNRKHVATQSACGGEGQVEDLAWKMGRRTVAEGLQRKSEVGLNRVLGNI